MKPELRESEPGPFGPFWITNRDFDQTALSVAKKSIPLPLGVMDPAQILRLRFTRCDI